MSRVGGAVAMVLCYSFDMLYWNSGEPRVGYQKDGRRESSGMGLSRESHCNRAVDPRLSSVLFSNPNEKGAWGVPVGKE